MVAPSTVALEAPVESDTGGRRGGTSIIPLAKIPGFVATDRTMRGNAGDV
jgi:hypothetical protein